MMVERRIFVEVVIQFFDLKRSTCPVNEVVVLFLQNKTLIKRIAVTSIFWRFFHTFILTVVRKDSQKGNQRNYPKFNIRKQNESNVTI